MWCALLFPRDLAGYDGFRDYFYSRRRWFFGLVLAGQAVDVADTLLKGLDHFRSLGPSYMVVIVILSVLLLIAMRTRSERFHGALAIFAVAYLLAYPWLIFDTVGQGSLAAQDGRRKRSWHVRQEAQRTDPRVPPCHVADAAL